MQQPDISQLMQLIRSPAGQQLMKLLQQQGGDALQTARNQAASGNFSQARDTLAPVLDTPQIRALLQQLGGTP